MSRETDSPSSGPNGRGGAAYPSGTPPYGTPTASDAGTDAGRSAAQPEDRKTETTLTTRIRINIPGSRPIPPVVMRTPVADTEGSDGDLAVRGARRRGRPRPWAPSSRRPSPLRPPRRRRATGSRPASPAPAKGGQGGGATNGAGLPGGSGAQGAPAARPARAPWRRCTAGRRSSRRRGRLHERAGRLRPGGANGGAPRPGGTNGAGLPGATGGPVAPGHGGGTGSFDVTEALAAGPLGNGARRGGEPRRDDLPYFSEGEHGVPNGPGGQGGYGRRRAASTVRAATAARAAPRVPRARPPDRSWATAP